nr:RNA-directed DNA polymerase, eukaryota, reverse transcriptase zinc-binding domain protein [Tanacetum cinerariifolium]
MALTFADTHNMISYLTKSDASEGLDQILNSLNASSIQYALTINPNIYVSCIKQFWSSVLVKKVNDVVRLQALIDRKKVIITEAIVREALRLDDAESIDCLPNEEIFIELARMGGHHGISSVLPWLQLSFAFQQESDSLGVETPLFEGMLVPQQAAADVDDVVTNDVAIDDVPADAKPTPPSPPPTTPPPPQELPSTSQVVPTHSLECHIILPQIQDNSCSKELHIAPVVGDLMVINEYSDVKAKGVADNLMPGVVIKECFDDAKDYKDISLKYGEAYLDFDMANNIRVWHSKYVNNHEKMKLKHEQRETNLIYWEWDKVIDLVSEDEAKEDEDWSITMKYQECHTILPQIQDNSCSKELHIAQVVGDLMAINEYSDVKAEGVVYNLMPGVVIKECFDDAKDYKASFDLVVVFVTDIQLEVLEISESYVLKLFRNLNVTPNTHGDFYQLGKKLKCHPEYIAPVNRSRFFVFHISVAKVVIAAFFGRNQYHLSSGVGVSPSEVSSFATLTGCNHLITPFTYLGLPIDCNMARIKSWDPIVEKFSKRLLNWRASLLSVGGRATLITSVLGALGTYYFSLFPMPSLVNKKLKTLRANFFWGNGVNSHKIHWISWNVALASKEKEGIGFGSLFALNQALILKWRWRFLNNPNALWARLIVAIHGHNTESTSFFSHTKIKGVWSRIVGSINRLHEKNIISLSSMKRHVNNGATTKFWHDVWAGSASFKSLFPRLFHLAVNKDCFVRDNWINGWSFDWVRNIISGPNASQLALLQNTISAFTLNDSEDPWAWTVGGHSFSVSSARHLI